VVADYFVDDEPQELLAECWIESGRVGEFPEPRYLYCLAIGVGRRQTDLRLVFTDPLRDLEPFGEKMDERGVDIVDTCPRVREYFVVIHEIESYRPGGYVWSPGFGYRAMNERNG
jgi:hypothetical protein